MNSSLIVVSGMGILGIFALLALALMVMSFLTRQGGDWPQAGKSLLPCPRKSNCVCSLDTRPVYAIAQFSFEGDPERALEKLDHLLSSLPRTRIVDRRPAYLRAECVSFLFRFIDDVEFLLDREKSVIEVRSASRAGFSDFGVNRKRVESWREMFLKK